MPSYAARLAEIRIPVEVLVGGLDHKFHTLPHPGTRQVVDGAGHNLLIERPDVVARAIARGART
jgi:pimeloyl-ACP methyl ester carboxylesterase